MSESSVLCWYYLQPSDIYQVSPVQLNLVRLISLCQHVPIKPKYPMVEFLLPLNQVKIEDRFHRDNYCTYSRVEAGKQESAVGVRVLKTNYCGLITVVQTSTVPFVRILVQSKVFLRIGSIQFFGLRLEFFTFILGINSFIELHCNRVQSHSRIFESPIYQTHCRNCCVLDKQYFSLMYSLQPHLVCDLIPIFHGNIQSNQLVVKLK